ncbi:MAG: hypothetical protein IKC23_11490 [Fibrobacter sp.]|nr:hypothetical protein [Fibrobacter sp.]
MLAKRQNGLFLFVSTLLLMAAWGFAGVNYSGDCINDAKPDSRCVYLPLDVGQMIGLYVEDPPKSGNRLKNAPLYVYAPNAGSDTIVFTVESDVVANGQMFTSDNNGYVVTGVTGHWTVSNAPLGVSVNSSMQDVNVIYVYNFYVPEFQFCEDADCKEVISDISNIQLNVGDTLPVYVQSVVPLGPSKGKLDTLAKDLQYFLSSKHEDLKFLTPAKTPMGHGTINGTKYYIGQLSESRSSFLVTSDKAISDVNFTLESSIYNPKPDSTVFRAKEEFPGNLQFVNYGLPSLDSAFIYDTDGDGVGDSIAAYFNGQMNGVSLENFQYNWPMGGDYTDFSGDFTLDGHLAELTGVKTTIPDGEGQGNLKVDASSTVSGASGNLSTAIQDRIGPVIQTATLEPGDGDYDYVILSFNKPLDTSWTSGSGFLLDGIPLSMTAVEKGVDGNDRIWKFKVPKNSVQVGGELELATSCAKDKCPDGLIKAADGNKTGKNNPVKITNSGKNYVDDERNGFYDKNGDGRMDSATVAFKEPISKKDLEDMEVVLYWMDNQGNVLEIKPDLTDTNFVKLSKDGLMLSITVDTTKFDVQRMLTYVDTAGIDVDSLKYGFAKVTKPVVQADGTTKMETYDCTMHDRMSPVISGTFLEPESFQKMEADVLTISFSEPVDKKALEDLTALSDCFKFKVDGEWVSIPFSSLEWSKDGKSVKLHLENGVPLAERLNPADSIKFDFDKAKITDLDGNGVSPNSQPTMVKGDPRVLMQSTSLASLDRAVLLADKAAFTERFVNADEPMDEEMKKSLGVLMDISFATVMGEDSTGVSKMNLDDVGLSWELKVFTNLGAYVGGASNKIKCSDKAFEGNCFEHAKKMYVRWNMRSSEGRKVGVGVYVAQFKINVYGAKDNFKVERIYNWGIRAGKGGMSLGD